MMSEVMVVQRNPCFDLSPDSSESQGRGLLGLIAEEPHNGVVL